MWLMYKWGVQAFHAHYLTHPGPVQAQVDWAGPVGCLRRQSWGQMLEFLLSTESQWPSGQVLMLGEQVEKFLEIPVIQSGPVTAAWEHLPYSDCQSQEGSTSGPSGPTLLPKRPEQRKTTHGALPAGASL